MMSDADLSREWCPPAALHSPLGERGVHEPSFAARFDSENRAGGACGPSNGSRVDSDVTVARFTTAPSLISQ
jgi:hypothetical protein